MTSLLLCALHSQPAALSEAAIGWAGTNIVDPVTETFSLNFDLQSLALAAPPIQQVTFEGGAVLWAQREDAMAAEVGAGMRRWGTARGQPVRVYLDGVPLTP